MSETPTQLNLSRLLRGSGLGPMELLMLMAVASYGDYDLTNIRPALATVAADYKINVKTVRKTVAALRDKGILKLANKGTGGKGNPSRYYVDLSPLKQAGDTLPPGGRVSDESGGLYPPTFNRYPPISGPIPSHAVVDDQFLPVSTKKEAIPSFEESSAYAAVGAFPSSMENRGSKATAVLAPAVKAVGNHQFIEADFEKWLHTFPRRQNRPHNRRAVEREYRLALEKVGAGVLQATAALYATKGVDPQFVPLAQNWLKRECWGEFYKAPREPTEWERARHREFLVSMERQSVREELYARHCGQKRPRGNGFKEWETGCYAWLGAFTDEQAAEAEAEAVRRAKEHPTWK